MVLATVDRKVTVASKFRTDAFSIVDCKLLNVEKRAALELQSCINARHTCVSDSFTISTLPVVFGLQVIAKSVRCKLGLREYYQGHDVAMQQTQSACPLT